MGNHGSRAQAATVPVPRIKIISPTASPSTPTHKPRAAPYNLDGPVDFEDIPAMPDHRHRRGEQSYELESDYMDRPRGRGRVARHGNDTGVRRYSPPRMEPSLSPVPRRRRSDRHQSQRKKRAESPGCSRSAKWKTLYVLAAELVICFVEPKGGWGQYHKKDKSKDARERYSAESGRRQRHRDRRGRTYYSDDESDEREYTARIIPRDLSPPDYESSNRAEVGSKRRSYR
ncbi:hypothetical protein PVAG01_11416 [Phlyctema vagabunda]|uniref:Uncharacterized protein n=1 Tax=Phlyctema vagabunda TaxID=108571 RepID=A0ABR4P2A4_9HELO